MFQQGVLLRRAERTVRRGVRRAVPSPKQAQGNVSACRTMIVGTVRRAETGSWGCFGVPNPARGSASACRNRFMGMFRRAEHDREDGT